jgi:mono/diheme cytochrome c family protein
MNPNKGCFLLNPKRTHKIIVVCSLILCFMISPITGQDGKTLFKDKCASCHSIGKGRLVGPDLKGVTSKQSIDWLIKWTKASQDLVRSGDPAAKAIFDEFGGVIMPNQDMPDADIKAVFAYIDSQSIGKSAVVSADSSKATEVVVNTSDKATPQDIALGEQLFTGTLRLATRGPACISCHNVDYKGMIPGGLLAKDLTTVFSRMGGDVGLQGILGAPPFPAMTAAYKDHPITPEEIGQIIAFLRKVDTDKAMQVAPNNNLLLYSGAGGFCLLILLYSLIWLRRKQFTVKKDIYNRQLKSI